MQTEPKQFGVVRATFMPDPEYRDSLKKAYVPHIGRTYHFQYIWVCDEDSLFPGQWALQSYEVEEGFPPGWVPACDLVVVETIRQGIPH